MAEFKFKAFITYSHSDEKWASWLHKGLETYRLPKHIVGQETKFGSIPRRLVPIFRDRDELSTATDLGEVLNAALADSATQIVICSPAAAASHWVNEEILAFKRLERSHRIFCLIVAGEPYASAVAGKEDQECFPAAVRYQLDDNGDLSDRPAEPIAADVRPGKDGKVNAKLKLISGLLGVGFDVLRQREVQRRQRRLAIITAATSLGMIIAFGLAWTAFIARDEAVKQRARAEAEAETAHQTTEFMVDLFSVSDPSEARGNSITAREILDKGAKRIEAELADQPAVQARLMDTMGSVYKGLGLYPQARNLAEGALQRRVGLYGDFHVEVAASRTELGDVMRLQADYDAALIALNQALKNRKQLLGADHPDVAESLLAVAEVLAILGRYEEAGEVLDEVLIIQRQQPDESSLEIAATLEELGLNNFDMGNYAAAQDLLEQSIAMQRRLLAGDPHPELAVSLQNLAVVEHDLGNYDEAGSLFQEVLDMRRQLFSDNHPDIAAALNNIAFVLHDQGDLEGARRTYLKVADIYASTVGTNHPDYAQVRQNLAYVVFDEGDAEVAIAMADESLQIYRTNFPGDNPEVADALGNLGNWLVYDGRYEEAEPLLLEAVVMGRNVYGEGHAYVATSMIALALLYIGTDRSELALETARDACEIFVSTLSEDHWRTAWARNVQGAALVGLARYETAEPLLLESHADLAIAENVRAIYVTKAREHLVALYSAWGRPAEAARYGKSVSQ
jgi:tetratricopeptide (TPR) repeat protein